MYVKSEGLKLRVITGFVEKRALIKSPFFHDFDPKNLFLINYFSKYIKMIIKLNNRFFFVLNTTFKKELLFLMSINKKRHYIGGV